MLGLFNQTPKAKGLIVAKHWTVLCEVSQVPDSEQAGHYVTIGNRSLAIFRHEGIWQVIDDTCPHAGASLSAGYVAEGCVFCPWHAWPFDLKTGVCPDNEQIAVHHYPVRERAGQLEAVLD